MSLLEQIGLSFVTSEPYPSKRGRKRYRHPPRDLSEPSPFSTRLWRWACRPQPRWRQPLRQQTSKRNRWKQFVKHNHPHIASSPLNTTLSTWELSSVRKSRRLSLLPRGSNKGQTLRNRGTAAASWCSNNVVDVAIFLRGADSAPGSRPGEQTKFRWRRWRKQRSECELLLALICSVASAIIPSKVERTC